MSTEAPPNKSPEKKERRRVQSLVLVHTGDGKGKSSSAFGVVIRSVARNWNVAVIQFLKSGRWNTGEEKICREKLGVDWWAIGEGFSWESEDLSEDEAVAQAAWAHAKEGIASGEYQLVVLDEVTYPANWGWISKEEIVLVGKDIRFIDESKPIWRNLNARLINRTAFVLILLSCIVLVIPFIYSYITGFRQFQV